MKKLWTWLAAASGALLGWAAVENTALLRVGDHIFSDPVLDAAGRIV